MEELKIESSSVKRVEHTTNTLNRRNVSISHEARTQHHYTCHGHVGCRIACLKLPSDGGRGRGGSHLMLAFTQVARGAAATLTR